MKKWNVKKTISEDTNCPDEDAIIGILLSNRGLMVKTEIDNFLNPIDPHKLTSKDIGIDKVDLSRSIKRIYKAINEKESIVVYADYDADGICAGAVLWETLNLLGAKVMPYIPHRVEEGYGLSEKGIDSVVQLYDPSLIITVDHGITGHDKVLYAKKLGIDVIVTDHHVKPDVLPDCPIIHTTMLSGSGISWFLSKEIFENKSSTFIQASLVIPDLSLAAIGTIADMVPLVGPNRAIAKYGLEILRKTKRIGLVELFKEAGLDKENITTHSISHVLAPRLNAMGRLVHAMDALRLLCTNNSEKAVKLTEIISLTNKERQQMTVDTTVHALDSLNGGIENKKLLFLSNDSYNQGIIGLVAGKLVEQYYLPAIVIARGEKYSKASARSISGFNIIEAIRSFSDILVDVGGHPMAAGFTVETSKIELLKIKLEEYANENITSDILTKTLNIDLELPLISLTEELYVKIRQFEPFGMGNYEPIFATRNVKVVDQRLVGADGKHLKLKITDNVASKQSSSIIFDCIGFGLGREFLNLKLNQTIDIAYTLDINIWNGKKFIQLKIKDIILPN